MSNRSRYKIKCLRDDLVFDSVEDLCKHYGMTYDQVYYRIDHIKDYKDGLNFERIIDNTDALESVQAVDSQPFVDKYGDKTVPLPGYEDKYTISTKGVIRNIKSYNRVIPVKTTLVKKHTVILHTSDNKRTQTHSLVNLMKKAFGDPYNNVTEVQNSNPDKDPEPPASESVKSESINNQESVRPVFGAR